MQNKSRPEANGILHAINTTVTSETVRAELDNKLSRYFGIKSEEATQEQIYKAVILTVKDLLTVKKTVWNEKVKQHRAKKVYYMCMEFLVGRQLRNNLCNLGVTGAYRAALDGLGINLEDIYEFEPDPGLGNGGLGRLAACFLDSLTTLDYPACGFSICYEYGLFKQKIIGCQQIELSDDWMPGGEGWLIARADKSYSVKMGGHVTEKWENGSCSIIYEDYEEVKAVPYDMMISGYGSEAVSTLRLWRARDAHPNINMSLFSQGQYIKAMQENTNSELISKVLYPSDNHTEGKLLRLSQQYFLASASLQSIIDDHLSEYGTLYNLPEKIAIHINDTHPTLVIPELMRILMDVYSYTWDAAWSVVTSVVSYTNHTVLSEALECWNADLFSLRLPRIYMIIKEINRRLCADLWTIYPGDWDRISRMSVVAYSQLRMANLSVAAANTVNGVSKLHSEILKDTLFNDYYKAMPYKFTNVTNGIAHRRWLCQSNPQLCALLDECIGPRYRLEPERLSDFSAFANDASVLDRLEAVKRANKEAFANFIMDRTCIMCDVESIFDSQVKRMHEYKRQLLNVLKIISMYNELQDNPNADIPPQTFIFGGKAAPSYHMAKYIISLICNLSRDIERSPILRDRIRVIFLEDYNVSQAELLMPATDISEQISLAGKEASGTGCMKFMINGAVTVGTLDGANIEMKDAVGGDNIYIFGLTSEEVNDLWKRGYSSINYYRSSERLRLAVDALNRGFNGRSFTDMANYLLAGFGGIADPYMCLVDFDSYYAAYTKAVDDYADRESWLKKSLVNISAAGYFSSDRAIGEYADKIWHIDRLTAK